VIIKITCGVLLASLAMQPAASPRAVPVDAATAILDAFKTHDIVALGEPHGNEQAAAFRIALIQNPRFAATVNDVVVESGNSRYQDVMDRFVRGDAVDDATFRKVWQNTTQSHTLWDVPIYEQFFRAVRTVNQNLPRPQQIRVLLGDPPIDWDRIDRGEESNRGTPEDRVSYPVELIRREIIARKRHALIVYGGMHFRHRNVNNDTVAARLERAGVDVFTVWPDADGRLELLQPDVRSWPTPSLALLKGTTLGARAFDLYLLSSNVQIQNGQIVPPTLVEWRQLPMEQQFDAVLYLGPLASMTQSKLSSDLCSDQRYMAMRMARMANLPVPPGAPSAVDQLKQYCASVARR
jgi:hypothetical protein